ncbi:flavohemoglobin expression-modulating QEGLA motif protein [Sphingobacterium spiritivorum]|uniref:flavohemoglobin expression-modulating QEGLA motif protein n=1 Tax=Sphingobacterium spiritivorum TaxID=258 RepID=UPI003DA2D52D
MEQAKSIQKAIQAIKQKEPVHIQFAGEGKLVFKRINPFLLVYRIPESGKDQMISALAKSEVSFLIGKEKDINFQSIVQPVVRQLIEEFGACLLIEIWREEDLEQDIAIHLSQKTALNIAEKLRKSLQGSDDPYIHLSIDLQKETKFPKPAGTEPLIDPQAPEFKQLLGLGLSIKPRYIDQHTGKPYPLILRSYRDTFSRSIRKSFLEFIRMHTSMKVSQFKMLGTTELQPLVWEIDRALAQESQRFDFLLLVSPINSHEAWLQFRKDKFMKTPRFQYRPMPIDPELVKRNLYNLRIEDLDDPTIAYLFRDKRKELDAMMTMLMDRGNTGFLHGSLQIFGNVDDKLLETAKAILVVYGGVNKSANTNTEMLNAQEFSKLAREELRFLQHQLPTLESGVRVREDISGIMVNRGILNISTHYRIEKSRALALLQHEVGTHIVTYFNGKSQPFKLFSLGVPGYEQLQEGLAVFSEFMVGGLTPERLRILAARVVAVHHMLAGNTFVDTFFLLVEDYEFDEETAFHMTSRVYRGGGLTKDALYLKGLLGIIEYIRQGRNLSALTVGKIREDYIPIVEELTQRGLLLAPVLKPRYLSEPYLHNISAITQGGNIFNLSKF